MRRRLIRYELRCQFVVNYKTVYSLRMIETAEPTTDFERLQKAREAKGYDTASDAARAMGVTVSTYVNHENGNRGFPHVAVDYANFYGVSLDWLMLGRGEMRGRQVAAEIKGALANGAFSPRGSVPELEGKRQVLLPRTAEVGALLVKGNAYYPRVLDGEYILYSILEQKPDDLDGEVALVETPSGERLLRIIRKIGGQWMAEKFGAGQAEIIEPVRAWRYLGSLARHEPV
ncbi:transcriptional regulator with XRE-family HTH domain [Rhodoblastus acidophilus]|uniref:helix-turn-helix domain-containing protein n=1 Tax=Rhodoblastus acidophilus TaxID=1074 RepID=UPI002224BC38|nr:helix-turn-helix transcriptional regulator [Rhodoblastus acidophilus]MCW2315290.1 transcriptional regulator with XRE-family HTH domain [Rhodoblastus acidophilus]